jgi:hypothetical protein
MTWIRQAAQGFIDFGKLNIDFAAHLNRVKV